MTLQQYVESKIEDCAALVCRYDTEGTREAAIDAAWASHDLVEMLSDYGFPVVTPPRLDRVLRAFRP